MTTRLARWMSVVLAGVIVFSASNSYPDETDASPKKALSLPGPTAGGKQLWSDELLFHDWRIQRYVVTGHYRLLDGKNKRHAVGNFEYCRQRLDQIRRENNLPAMSGKAVIALHGLGRTRKSMASLCDYLRTEGNYAVFNVSYPSTRRDLAAHAQSLANILANLEGIEEINFVAHSMGNVVIRHYLADQTDPKADRKPDPRIRRIVMLAPPNNGAQLAVKMQKNPLSKLIFGTSSQQLGDGWQHLSARLAMPQCEFGILAGGKGKQPGRNPLLDGDDDLIVTVDETRLAGAHDFLIVPAAHTFIMNNKDVQQYTLRFLQHGYFISADRRQPIARDQAAAP